VPFYGSDCAENERDMGTVRPELFLSEITTEITGNPKYMLVRHFLLAISRKLGVTSVTHSVG